jgi:seryl-tRNA synthetase
MLDIRLLREDAETVKRRLATRGGDHASLVDDLLLVDAQRRAAETELQALQQERNARSKEIGAAKGRGEETTAIEAAVREVGEAIGKLGDRLDGLNARQGELLHGIPNLPDAACPEGENETANPEIRVWGEKPQLSFEPKDHLELGERTGILDFEAGARITGSGFCVFRGAGARLERALINFLLDLHTGEHRYLEVAPPFLIARDCMTGTGQLPKFEADMYGLEDGELFLAPTAEVPVTNLERGKILALEDLPIRYVAATPCFRREAGAAGKENRGLIRMHQFDKVELVKIVHPDESDAELETLLGDAEKVLQLLGLHYRVIELCSGDLGFSARRTYDIEVWAPGQAAYLEVSSCSNFGDYQARRMNLRFKDDQGTNRFAHTLNGSGTALPRLYVALLETFQQQDGSIEIPAILQPYFGSEKIG